MAWRQIVSPDLDPYVYVNGALLTDWYGWCLATIECAYSSPRLYPNAWAGWLDTKAKHEDRDFPVGVYFPIWFSGYGGLGHVAIAHVNPNGSMGIWTSPFKHVPYFYTGYSSVDALASGYGVDYVGWSEDIAGLSVIQWFDDTPPPVQVPSPTPEPAPVPEPPADPLPEPPLADNPPVQPPVEPKPPVVPPPKRSLSMLIKQLIALIKKALIG